MSDESKFGIILTDKVDLDYLKSIESNPCKGYIKVVVNKDTGYVAVGMGLHKSASVILGNPASLYGANIYFDDGSIKWDSTLNIPHNEKNGTGSGREITDQDTIEMLNGILSNYIYLV